MPEHKGPFGFWDTLPKGVQITRLPPAGFPKGQKAKSAKQCQRNKKPLELPPEDKVEPSKPANNFDALGARDILRSLFGECD